MMNMSGFKALLSGLLLAVAGAASASSGVDIRMEPSPANRLDLESQQRGARTFVNYCLNCHTARYMRYNRLTDLGLTEEQIRDNLMFATAKIGDTMTVAMTPADSKAWFGVTPPDLTVEARVRGADWLYNYFLGFYRDDAAPSGWNNLVFPNVAMPHVLAELSGSNRLVTAEFKDHEQAQAAALAAKGIVVLAPGKNHTYIVNTLAADTPGTLTPTEYRQMVADLVNFLDYMGEPAKNKRISLGLIVLLYLGVLFVFAYWLKREYWKDVH
jgi:ubiquinol-cytochrome c reductase cytochrome c1 subunit